MGRKQYTDAEKAAFRSRDRALTEAADAALAAPDAGEQVTALALRSPKLAAYSPRNLMMLVQQAEAAGLHLTEVDTGRGWRERGRTIRKGSKSVLRIVYPIRRARAADPAGEGEEGATLFRTKALFEVSQTEPQTGTVPDPDATDSSAEVEQDAAAIWRERLDREADKLGLTVVDHACDGGTASAVLDAEARTVIVTAADPLTPAALGALAQRIAEAYTSANADRPRTARSAGHGSAEADEGIVLEFD